MAVGTDLKKQFDSKDAPASLMTPISMSLSRILAALVCGFARIHGYPLEF